MRIQQSEIELRHIQLELQNSRGNHLRHFVDQYYCFENNFVTRNGKPAWNKIFWSGWVSPKAAKVSDRNKVVKEHIVPIKVVKGFLLDLGQNASIGEIRKVLDDWVHLATITKEEDMLLNRLGLDRRMPDQFYDSGTILFNDKFARYKFADIEIIKRP